MKNIIVLGAGMVGSAIAIDLSKKHNVSLTDLNQDPLIKAYQKCNNLKTFLLDVTKKSTLQKTIKGFDLVVCAVPGFLGFETLKSIIEAEINVVDISFFSENSLELDALAKDKNITAIVDCGVAPGMDNIILGYYNEKMKLTDFECLVGGLPKVKKWPFCYKAPFSPIDVIEEYTRPARYIENGEMITRDALTDCEYIEFQGVGTLESFNSDGLRSIIFTMPHIKNMKEKTLRYPGHVEYIKVLKKSGFFDTAKIEINGTKLSPLDVTSKITEYLSPVIPVVLGPQDYGDATVGYIRGQDAELGGSGDFITWKFAINYDKLGGAWQWLDQPATLFLVAAAATVDDVYASQRSAVALEIRGSSQTPISNNITLNYPRGI